MGSPSFLTTFSARLAAGVLLLNLFVITLAGVSALQGHRQYRERAEVTTQNLAQVLESRLVESFQRIDIVLWQVLEDYQQRRAAGPIETGALNADIERVRSRLPEVDALRIADAQGWLLYGSGVTAAAKVNIADRPQFARLRDEPGAGLVFSKPQISRINSKWVIVLARRITRKDGSFDGIVFAAMALDQIGQLFASLDLGPGGAVILRDAELGLIVRQPDLSQAGLPIGSKPVSRELQRLHEAGASSATYFSALGSGNFARTVTFRKLGSYPLYLTVGLARSDYLAGWRHDTANLAALVGLFIVATVAAAVALRRADRRQRRSSETLIQQEALYHELVENTSMLVVRFLPDTTILFANAAYASFFGQTPEELAGKRWVDFVPGDEAKAGALAHIAALRPDQPSSSTAEQPLAGKNGEIRWTRWTDRAFFGRKGEIAYLQAVGADITESKLLEIELLEMATTDFLTGLFNRRHFMARMGDELERLKRHEPQCAAVLMLDLDYFKKINDRFGHAAGDEVLRHFAGLVRAELRKTDAGARVGGEEFAILLAGADAEAASAFAERLRQKVADTPALDHDQQLAVTVSIGIAVMRAGDARVDDSLGRADAALYRAKELGRNRVELAAADQGEPLPQHDRQA